MATRVSPLATALEPLAASLWTFFVLLSVAVAANVTFGGTAFLARHVDDRGLLLALLWIFDHLELAWIILAATSVYATVAARAGLAPARRWALIVLVGIMALAWLQCATPPTPGLFGAVQYSSRLGMKLGPVPVGVPLVWLAIILSAREVLLRHWPRASEGRIALGVGAIAALCDLNLEPFGARWRGFWFWRPGRPGEFPVFDAPALTWLVWGTVAGLLAWMMRERQAASSVPHRSAKPLATLLIFNGVFLLGHLWRHLVA